MPSKFQLVSITIFIAFNLLPSASRLQQYVTLTTIVIGIVLVARAVITIVILYRMIIMVDTMVIMIIRRPRPDGACAE